jgi:hypothetical protein
VDQFGASGEKAAQNEAPLRTGNAAAARGTAGSAGTVN